MLGPSALAFLDSFRAAGETGSPFVGGGRLGEGSEGGGFRIEALDLACARVFWNAWRIELEDLGVGKGLSGVGFGAGRDFSGKDDDVATFWPGERSWYAGGASEKPLRCFSVDGERRTGVATDMVASSSLALSGILRGGPNAPWTFCSMVFLRCLIESFLGRGITTDDEDVGGIVLGPACGGWEG